MTASVKDISAMILLVVVFSTASILKIRIKRFTQST